LLPNFITYTALIAASEKNTQPERGLEVFHALRRQGALPNAITYDTLIICCDKGYRATQALEVF